MKKQSSVKRREIVLITGGAGFVGANLAIGLKERHPRMRIVALDNLKRRGSELNIGRLQQRGIEFVHGDVRNPEDLYFPGCRIATLIECSAEPSVLAGYRESPQYLLNSNLIGAVNCLEAARRDQAGFLFLSTSRVYPFAAINSLSFKEAPTRYTLAAGRTSLPGAVTRGAVTRGAVTRRAVTRGAVTRGAVTRRAVTRGVSTRGISELFPLEGTRSLYGAGKLAAELLAAEYAEMYHLNVVINRCGVIAGPWQMGKVDQGVFTLWMAAHYFRKPLSYIGFGGSGKQVRDLLHIDDLVELIDRQLQDMPRFSGNTYNVGGGLNCSLSLQEATLLCREISGNRIPIGRRQENRPADVIWYISDTRKIRRDAGWKPQRKPAQILQDIRDWIRENENSLRPILG